MVDRPRLKVSRRGKFYVVTVDEWNDECPEGRLIDLAKGEVSRPQPLRTIGAESRGKGEWEGVPLDKVPGRVLELFEAAVEADAQRVTVLRSGGMYIVTHAPCPLSGLERAWLYNPEQDGLGPPRLVGSFLNHVHTNAPWEACPTEEIPSRLLELFRGVE
jgi:hypothetical protein